MPLTDLLTDAFGRALDHTADVVDGLDVDALAFRPDAEANSIAWLCWHAARVQDDHVAALADVEQVWTARGFADRFGLPFEVTDIGYGHDTGQVAQVRPDDGALLVAYHQAVTELTCGYIERLDDAEARRVVDTSWDPPVTAGVRLVSVLDDVLQHLGQAAYVRGLITHGG